MCIVTVAVTAQDQTLGLEFLSLCKACSLQ